MTHHPPRSRQEELHAIIEALSSRMVEISELQLAEREQYREALIKVLELAGPKPECHELVVVVRDALENEPHVESYDDEEDLVEDDEETDSDSSSDSTED